MNKSRRFVSFIDQMKMNQSLSQEKAILEAAPLSTAMVIRRPSPVSITMGREYGAKPPSPWHQFQDLVQIMRFPANIPMTITIGGASQPVSTGIFELRDLNPSDSHRFLSDFLRKGAVTNRSTPEAIDLIELGIRRAIPERNQNEHRQLAELVCTKGGPDTIHYYILQLFNLANNFVNEGSWSRYNLDCDVIRLVESIESKSPGKLKELLELDDSVLRSATEKVFESAIMEGEAEILQVILEAGFNPNRTVHEPLHGMCPAVQVAVGLKDEHKAVCIVQLLANCEHELECQAQSAALHRALAMGREAIADILLRAKVPFHMPSIVLTMNHPQREPPTSAWIIIRKLLARGGSSQADLISAFNVAFKAENEGIIRGLLKT
ncbi:hypothetical protein QBC38DRAFT_447844 [Podospora fimiseda]|uniref:Ankyrin repeat protein n=1 Tax=Podospora fimiseda TaxID=252190 RepID=A0AAN6YRQ7_9PEZI|nr:hypothetical protein QBC38DRAFT_447844 [Podospora fimiseda]